MQENKNAGILIWGLGIFFISLKLLTEKESP